MPRWAKMAEIYVLVCEVTITGHEEGVAKDLVIPEKIGDYVVTAIVSTPARSAIYGMDGKMVRPAGSSLASLAKGVYIQNGKKLVVK